MQTLLKGTGGFQDGPLPDASVRSPNAIAVGRSRDGGELLFVGDRLNRAIRRIDVRAGRISTHFVGDGGLTA